MKKMKITQKPLVVMLCALLGIGLSAGAVCAEDTDSAQTCTIRQELDVSSCRQGDTITLTVCLQGDGSIKEWMLSGVKGVLEYDSSLFLLEKADVLPVESSHVSGKSFDQSTGEFGVTYDSDIAVRDGDPVIRLRLHVDEKATTGKTTVCVTGLEWQAAGGIEKNEIEHRIPSSVTISKAEDPTVAGDVNVDGRVTLTDVKYVMQYCNGSKKLNSQQKKNADMNGDGKVTLADAKLIMKYYNGEIDKL